MAAKNKFMNAMKMPAIADMFSSEADRQRESGDLVTEVPLSELHPFVNHPSRCETMKICRNWWTASRKTAYLPT